MFHVVRVDADITQQGAVHPAQLIHLTTSFRATAKGSPSSQDPLDDAGPDRP